MMKSVKNMVTVNLEFHNNHLIDQVVEFSI
ncbi:hypothetical protein J2S02_001115 [Metabacillus niabensis]|uniref:Uncharacterized protein n=1 Tax=Metabacillus niabensis TaxID=324854 RepID=A0ABT9YXS2_9BACI|nr:hypothetical protein [Metabacillus niabensis]